MHVCACPRARVPICTHARAQRSHMHSDHYVILLFHGKNDLRTCLSITLYVHCSSGCVVCYFSYGRQGTNFPFFKLNVLYKTKTWRFTSSGMRFHGDGIYRCFFGVCCYHLYGYVVRNSVTSQKT